jgi:hypothetical protein
MVTVNARAHTHTHRHRHTYRERETDRHTHTHTHTGLHEIFFDSNAGGTLNVTDPKTGETLALNPEP